MMLKITKIETENELKIVLSNMTKLQSGLWWAIFPLNISLCALGFWFNYAYCGSSIIFSLVCGLSALLWLWLSQFMVKPVTVKNKEELVKIIEKF